MKKLYRIIILLAALIFLTTYSPSGFNNFPKKKNLFLKIQNIEIINNHKINRRSGITSAMEMRVFPQQDPFAYQLTVL